jgi:hypothetical protein
VIPVSPDTTQSIWRKPLFWVLAVLLALILGLLVLTQTLTAA